MCLCVALFPVIVNVAGCNDRETQLGLSASVPNLNRVTKCRCPPPPLTPQWNTLDWSSASFIAFKLSHGSRAPTQGPWSIQQPPLPLRQLQAGTETERCKPDADRRPSCQTTCAYKGSLWWMATGDCLEHTFLVGGIFSLKLPLVHSFPQRGVFFPQKHLSNSRSKLYLL